MSTLIRLAFAVLLLLPLARAEANSFYWDPSFNGEGWSIDRQNDIVFLAWYTYDGGNQPTFLTAVGRPAYSVVRGEDASEDVHVAQFTDTLIRSRRGQAAEQVGTLTFRHEQGDGIDRIIVNAAGQQRTLVPFTYAYPTPGDALLGLWAFSFIDADLGVDGSLLLFEEEAFALDDGGFVFGDDPASGREVLAVYLQDAEVIVFIAETGDPAVDLVAGVFHTVKDSRPMRGVWVLVDVATDEDLTELLPFTATKYRSLGELDAFGLYAPKTSARAPNASFRQRALGRLNDGGAQALVERLRARR
jgi:hypothetical protein